MLPKHDKSRWAELSVFVVAGGNYPGSGVRTFCVHSMRRNYMETRSVISKCLFFSILRREKKFIYFPLLSKLEWNCWSIICPCLEVHQFHFDKSLFWWRLLMSHFLLSVLPSFLPSTNIYRACSVCLKYLAKSRNKTGSCLHGTYTLWGDIDISHKKNCRNK